MTRFECDRHGTSFIPGRPEKLGCKACAVELAQAHAAAGREARRARLAQRQARAAQMPSRTRRRAAP